jgi:hypothetical protein
MKLRIMTTVEVVREVPFNEQRYPGMTLEEALAYERCETEDFTKAERISAFVDTIDMDGLQEHDTFAVHVEAVDDPDEAPSPDSYTLDEKRFGMPAWAEGYEETGP